MKMKRPQRRTPVPEEAVRLQKLLAEAGLGSRREIEGWISAGRVRINGEMAKLGDRASSTDRIRVDGRVIPLGRHHKDRDLLPLVIAYHKPEGELVTRRDPEDRPTVFRRLPKPKTGRWIAVGRLDINTSGLILFTTHGELANRLMHPSREIPREYAVRILGEVPADALAKLTQGVELEDGQARFDSVIESGGSGANRWFHVVLHEGRNREVRRMWEAVGCTVSRLIRVRYADIELGRRLFSGNWRALEEAEIRTLMLQAGLKPPARRVWSEDGAPAPSRGARMPRRRT